MKWKRLYNCMGEPHEILTFEVDAETKEEAVRKTDEMKSDPNRIHGYFLGPSEKSEDVVEPAGRFMRRFG